MNTGCCTQEHSIKTYYEKPPPLSAKSGFCGLWGYNNGVIHMISKKQRLANKKNAQHSSGPQSFLGKSLSSRNSLKHGLLSKNLIIRDEDPKRLSSLVNDLFVTLLPRGRLEEILVEKIGASVVRPFLSDKRSRKLFFTGI